MHKQPYIVFYIGAGDLNSGPYAFRQELPPTELSSQPSKAKVRFLCTVNCFLQYYMLLCLLSTNLPAFQKIYLEA